MENLFKQPCKQISLRFQGFKQVVFPSVANEVKDVGIWSAPILRAAVVDIGKEFDGVVFFMNDTAQDILVT